MTLFLPSLAELPIPQLPPWLQGFYPSRPRGRLLCNVMHGHPKGFHPTNFPSFTMILAIFLVFCIFGVCEGNPHRGVTHVKMKKRELHLNWSQGTSLVAQWLRIRLPMQGTRVRALVWEDPTCRKATKPVHRNY